MEGERLDVDSLVLGVLGWLQRVRRHVKLHLAIVILRKRREADEPPTSACASVSTARAFSPHRSQAHRRPPTRLVSPALPARATAAARTWTLKVPSAWLTAQMRPRHHVPQLCQLARTRSPCT